MPPPELKQRFKALCTFGPIPLSPSLYSPLHPFRTSLPSACIRPAANPSTEGGEVHQAKRKILIIDDDPDTVLLLRSILEAEGFEIASAGSRPAGVVGAKLEKPCCIILNCMMCGDEGLCTYRCFKTDNSIKDIPVIMLSSIAKETVMRSRFFKQSPEERRIPQPDAFLYNPPETDDLIETVHLLTEQAR
jgi:CheY-like chemotaxis protein